MTKTILLRLSVLNIAFIFSLRSESQTGALEEEESSSLSFITGEENKDVGASNK